MQGRKMPQGKFRISVCVAALVPVMGLAACVSPSLEDAAPRPEQGAGIADTGADGQAAAGSNAASQSGQVRDNSFVDEGATRNEKFPTFEVMPQGATAQLSEEEKRAILAEMKAIRSARGGGGSSAATQQRYDELKTIANTHGLEAKQEIQDQ
ncbi:hypothetical protein [Hoeflea prorocentri]|uniref:Lipoprotein n=1 Tax=Hoeflea prorocentri TaxID=1922333 RepID=A0A9X3ZH74_9HYPH|nr:hypothetical protein [Hoeflea prorocentri]MCY6380611.1 hypothetical protein [Hoeflea prorocentri]MDA5398411.1 hypothetical protein [Hoeflea prorocentri]